MAAADRARNIVPPWQRDKVPVARMLVRTPQPLAIDQCQARRLHRLDRTNETMLRCSLPAGHEHERHVDARWNCAWGRGKREHTHVTEL